MRFAIVILCAVILLLLTAVLPVGKGLEATAVYTSPVFIFLLALLSGASVWCCIKRKFSAKQIGFYLVHLGVVVILVGAFVGYVAGIKGVIQLSVRPPQLVNQLLSSEGDAVDLGFEIAAEDFQVKFYPPVYQLYQRLPFEEAVPGQMPYKQIGEFRADESGVCSVDGVGMVSNLWNEVNQEWTQRKMLPDGSFLNLAGKTPSFFGVTLLLDGKKLPVSINHPAQYKGWRFYLMSYDQNNQRFVQLSVRRDPGRMAVIIGIWLTIIGTFIFCFRKTGGQV